MAELQRRIVGINHRIFIVQDADIRGAREQQSAAIDRHDGYVENLGWLGKVVIDDRDIDAQRRLASWHRDDATIGGVVLAR